jgi:hypothetical protein
MQTSFCRRDAACRFGIAYPVDAQRPYTGPSKGTTVSRQFIRILIFLPLQKIPSGLRVRSQAVEAQTRFHEGECDGQRNR